MMAPSTLTCSYPFTCRKTERKITFEQFQEALKLLAETKYPGDAGGLKKITSKLTSTGSGPVTAGATVGNKYVYVSECVYVCVCSFNP